MLRHVALVRTDVSEVLSASFIRVTRIGELGTTLAVTSNRRTLVFLRSVRRLLVTARAVPSSPILVTLMKEALSTSETSVLTRATRRNIPKDAILHSHRRENLKSYIILEKFTYPESFLASRQSKAIGLSLADHYNMSTTDYQKQFGTFLTPLSATK
jgi:hypothetical protein